MYEIRNKCKWNNLYCKIKYLTWAKYILRCSLLCTIFKFYMIFVRFEIEKKLYKKKKQEKRHLEKNY